jgi:hypothetical protein
LDLLPRLEENMPGPKGLERHPGQDPEPVQGRQTGECMPAEPLSDLFDKNQLLNALDEQERNQISLWAGPAERSSFQLAKRQVRALGRYVGVQYSI